MNNRKGILFFSIVLIFLLVMASGNLLAQKKAVFFQGSTNAIFPNPVCGDYTCPGGVPDENPCYGPPPFGTLNPCPDANFHMRGREMLFEIVTTEPQPLVEGIIHMTVNWNWVDKDGIKSGPMWGTFILETDCGGVWEGHMTGYYDGETGIGTWDYVGHGTGSDIDGMQLKATSEGGPYGGAFQGRILRPGKP